MPMDLRKLAVITVLVLCGLATSAVRADDVVVVWPGDYANWYPLNTDVCGGALTASQDFVEGPASPPLGSGSYQMTVGSNGNSYALIYYNIAQPIPLAHITSLSYSTYVTDYNDRQAPFLTIYLDKDGVGGYDDRLNFEPVYQDASINYATVAGSIVPDQGEVVEGSWQTWDALAGGWYSSFATLGTGSGGPPLVTIEKYLETYPDALIVNVPNTDGGTGGGLRVAAGCGGASWPNFDGGFDALTLGINSVETVFDFETVGPPQPPDDDEGDDDDDDDGGGTAGPVPVDHGQIALTFDCADLGLQTGGAMTASGTSGNVGANGQVGNTFCHVIALNGEYVTHPGEIGKPEVISQGVVQAVDLFGLLPGGVPIKPFMTPVGLCMAGRGNVYFLNAEDRAVSQLPAGPSGNSTCVTVPASGTVVLAGTYTPGPAATSVAPATNGVATPLTDCMVTTEYMLRLRQQTSTSSTILDRVPVGTTLAATERLNGWFRVIYGSQQGWLSGDFVSTSGNCG